MNATKLFATVLLAPALVLLGCDAYSEGGAASELEPTARSTALAAIVDRYAACCSDCLAEPTSATNKETCKLNCEAVAVTAGEQLPGGPADPQLTSRLHDLGGCIHACHEDRRLSPTDRATCELTCEGATEVTVTAPAPTAPPAPVALP